MTVEIRFSGSGGQGILLAGEILAEALAVYDGKNVSLCTAYGGQVRGGNSRCDVLFCEEGEEIYFPEVVDADLLLLMTEESLNESIQNIKEGGIVIIDSSYIKGEVKSKGKVYSFPITLTVKEKLGSTMAANIMALGMMAGITRYVSEKALEWALTKKIPEKMKEINLKALQLGIILGQKMTQK